MQVAFRTDASLHIGSGHVMRCLTIADALRAQGAQCYFISRAHSGHFLEVIRQRGYAVSGLLAPIQKAPNAIENIVISNANIHLGQPQRLAHAGWLGGSSKADADETIIALTSSRPDWLVVDHYALDQRWEDALAPHCAKLLVIDDLADRPHRCELLLDQNLGRQAHDYVGLVPAHCQTLIGPQFALLRPEFAALRPYSLRRRQAKAVLSHLLITMGGVDQPNATAQVLQALKACALPQACRITVVMGLMAPWLQNVRELAVQMPWPTEVVINVNNMAQRMADSDLAIGAAGSTSWERCCLGLPTLMVVLAKNQKSGALALEAAQAARLIGDADNIAARLPLIIADLITTDGLSHLSSMASGIADGQGIRKVLHAMGIVNA